MDQARRLSKKLAAEVSDLVGVRRQAKRDAALAVFVLYRSQDESLKPKRRRASLAAALHMAVADTFYHTH